MYYLQRRPNPHRFDYYLTPDEKKNYVMDNLFYQKKGKYRRDGNSSISFFLK